MSGGARLRYLVRRSCVYIQPFQPHRHRCDLAEQRERYQLTEQPIALQRNEQCHAN